MTSTITCPRCHLPVEGDFKYCPECAFRLRPGPPLRAKPSAPPSRRGTLLFLLAGAALLAAGIFVGQQVHREIVIGFRPPARAHLRVVDIQEHLARIPSGVAEWASRNVYDAPPDDEVQQRFLDVLSDAAPEAFADTTFRDALAAPTLLENPLPLTNWTRALSLLYRHSQELVIQLETHIPVMTDEFDMMRYEVTCGQWSEFLESAQDNPAQLARTEWIHDLWRPPESEDNVRLEYARTAWLLWWKAVLDAYETRNEALPEEEREPPPTRPDWLSEEVIGVSDEHGVLMLIPPEWVRISRNGRSISWSIEEGTEDFPVTGISWWDVKIFITWAMRFLSMPGLTLPNWGEWQRAYHGGHAYRPPDDFDEQGDEGWSWPWRDRDIAQCNNRDFRPDDKPPSLRRVRRSYPTGNRGFTLEGVLNMPGNAAEWTDNYRLVQRGEPPAERILARTWEKDDLGNERLEAVACGGSYLSGIDACRAGSSETLDKRDRRKYVGFRLILRRQTSAIGR